jgi:hypothetical protein
MVGEINDFLADEGLEGIISASWIAAVASRLATLREEGSPLWPEVYFSGSVEKLAAILQGAEVVQLGKGPQEDSTATRALKNCAPLATGGLACTRFG